MRVLLINTLYYPTVMGGAQLVVQELAEGFVRLGHEVMVIALANGTAENYIHNGVNVVKLPLHNFYHPYVNGPSGRASEMGRGLWHLRDRNNLSMARSVGAIIRKFKPDIVNTHCLAGFSTSVWKIIAKQKIPCIHVLHDYYMLCVRSAMFDKQTKRPCKVSCELCSWFRSPAKRLSQTIDGVVGVSEFILNKHLSMGLFANSKYKVTIHNSFNLRGTPQAGPPSRPFRFGYLGSLLPEKGIGALINSFREIETGQATLALFGSGRVEYIAPLKESAGAGVMWMGEAPTEAALATIDALIVPSLWDEPFGRVVIEALSAGVPVIGSKRGGISEILEPTPSGFLFEPLEPGCLSETMKAVMTLTDQQYAELRIQAVERSKSFGRDQALGSYETLLLAAIEQVN